MNDIQYVTICMKEGKEKGERNGGKTGGGGNQSVREPDRWSARGHPSPLCPKSCSFQFSTPARGLEQQDTLRLEGTRRDD